MPLRTTSEASATGEEDEHQEGRGEQGPEFRNLEEIRLGGGALPVHATEERTVHRVVGGSNRDNGPLGRRVNRGARGVPDPGSPHLVVQLWRRDVHVHRAEGPDSIRPEGKSRERRPAKGVDRLRRLPTPAGVI